MANALSVASRAASYHIPVCALVQPDRQEKGIPVLRRAERDNERKPQHGSRFEYTPERIRTSAPFSALRVGAESQRQPPFLTSDSGGSAVRCAPAVCIRSPRRGTASARRGRVHGFQASGKAVGPVTVRADSRFLLPEQGGNPYDGGDGQQGKQRRHDDRFHRIGIILVVKLRVYRDIGPHRAGRDQQ